jgi:hypothetical protein
MTAKALRFSSLILAKGESDYAQPSPCPLPYEGRGETTPNSGAKS